MPPFVTRTGGAVEKVAVTGTMLGVCEDPRLDEVLVELRPGDALVMYTDGVTDARRSGGERFGEQRLLEALRRGAGASAAEQASGVEQAVLAHHLGAASDDRALVALRALR